ncbi:MAG: hypothetical protein M5U35_11435 [Roseovarius sp.]|nr:hypothetical protein [Roseovarius sp.]
MTRIVGNSACRAVALARKDAFSSRNDIAAMKQINTSVVSVSI